MLRKFLGQLLLRAWRAAWPRRAPWLPGTPRQAFDALLEADDFEGAQTIAAELAARAPDSYEAHLLLGRAHQKLHDAGRALEHFAAALRLRADDAELYDFRGSMYQELGRLPEAFADYERAMALRPDFPLASFHRAMARLLVGDYERGWDDYELRRLTADHAPAMAGLARWDGSPLAGRTMLVAREQGLGDEIMFASLLPQLLGLAGRCIVECDPRLAATFRRSFPAATIFGTPSGGGLPPSIAPASIDVAIEAGSLPLRLRRQAADFPRHQGYLKADPLMVARARARLAALGPGLKVGLSWTGGVRKTRRELRSLSPAQLLPLLRVPGVRFVSLQYTDDARDEVDALRTQHGIAVEHWPEVIEDYDQTAALVCALDLVISVCTSLVHLGGALGRPVWVMAPLVPEWRYGIAGTSMPWYPSVRLFRQSDYGQWQPVIETVAGELARAAARQPARSAAPDPLAAHRLGAACAMQGRYGDAIEALRPALDSARPDADAANLAGVCCSLLGEHAKALRYYDAAIHADANLADAYLNAGWSAFLLGSAEEKRLLHRWLALQRAREPVRGLRSLSPRLKLPEVTLCCVDCAFHDLAADALRASMSGIEFGDALFLSDRDCGVEGVRFREIARIGSSAEYSSFMVHRLHEHVAAGHVLVIQYDGFVLNPEAWDPRFCDYDFVGAPMRVGDDLVVGNGGFSLRSRKLLHALRDDPEIRRYDPARGNTLEDAVICGSFRSRLESAHGIRFAPPEVADRFAAGRTLPTVRSFGFHGLVHLARLYENRFELPDEVAGGISIVFRARTELGILAVPRTLEVSGPAAVWKAGADT